MRSAIRLLAIVYIAYLALTLLVLTPALNIVPHWFVKEKLGRELQTDIVFINPFTLSLEVRGAAIPEHDGQRFFGLDRAVVNVALESLWRQGVVFDDVIVEQLYLHIVQRADGNFNFSDMIPPPGPEEEVAEPSGLPAITVHRLAFQSERIEFTDESRAKPYNSFLDDLAIEVEDLSTVLADGKPYRLEATGEGGGRLRWEGTVSLPDAHSEGKLALTGIQLSTFWRFAEPWVNFELSDGTVTVAGNYSVGWGDELTYRIDSGKVGLADLNIAPKSAAELPDTDLALRAISLTGIELDGVAQHLDAGALSVEGLALSGWSEGTQVSLAELFALDLPPAEEQQAPATTEDGDAGWTAALGNFRLSDSSVRWRSEFTEPALLEVTPIEATAESIRWPLAGDTGLKLQLTVNGKTSAAIDGSLDLAQGNGALSYQLQGLVLPWFNPNFPAALKAQLTGGELQVAGDLTLADFSPARIAMDGSIDDFSGKITDTETSLTSWETVRWEKLVVDLAEHRVDMAKLSIDNYTGRIHINKDGSINAQKVWQQEVGEQAEQATESLAEGKPWTVNVPLVRITDSEIDFMDESLPIQFRTVIGDIDGNIKNISSSPGAATNVDIKGSVDGYAPVLLAGTAEPFTSPPALDLKLTFDGVDMTLLSPYSGTYAGYAIERGVLSLDLAYALRDDRLKGNNKVVINQMKLGEKIDSDKAADLPLELALALLTDSNGVIDMEVPVSGDVNDPDFSVGSVVLGAFVNLVTKAVTAPFNLLANLVNSEEDLQRINFSSGSAELKEPAVAKLTDLATAMAQRPDLDLVVTGRLQLKADRERLQKNLLQEQMVAAGLSQEDWASKGPAWEEAIGRRYAEMSPGATDLTVREQYLALAQAIPLDDAAMLALANDRAVAVKSYLVNTASLGADRVAIAKPDLDKKTNLYSGAELAIDI